MRKIIKKVIVKILFNVLNSKSGAGKFLRDQAASISRELYKKITHNGCELKFFVPNKLSHFRVDSFSQKEPDTLNWIDSMSDNCVFWDVGSNIGLYGIYAAKKEKIVYAFEPSVFNLELLARNIYINNLADKVAIIPISLSNKIMNSTMHMSSTDLGGALSTFDKGYGHDGKKLNVVFKFKTISMNMNDAVNVFKIPRPDYIKIDVDGIEHLILEGGTDVLSTAKEILIEVNEDYMDQCIGVETVLKNSGFELKEKTKSDLMGGNIVYKKTYNQIWKKIKI